MSDAGGSDQSHIAMQMANPAASKSMAGGGGSGSGPMKTLGGDLGSICGDSLNNVLHVESVSDRNPFNDIADGQLLGGPNVNAFKDMAEKGMGNELGHTKLEQATSFTEHSNAKLQNNTGAISQGQSQ